MSDVVDLIRALPPRPAMELMPKPCGDCAVKSGFYAEYSEAFFEMPQDEQLERSKRWFCHNDCNRACRGHADNIGIYW